MPLRDQLQASLGTAYTIERELGGGGMSRVFVAQETALRRLVVVKVLPPEMAEGISGDRFAREVLLAAQLQQANIVPVLTAGELRAPGDGRSGTLVPYYTMPFVDGETLRARMSQGGALPTGEAVSLLRDIARALAYAHARGIVHRDIKPENVLISGGAAMVTDFGIAKAIAAARTLPGLPTSNAADPLTMTGMSVGTPGYMAPEQAVGDRETDHRADFYAFGCVAYEMLSGEAPFGRRSAMELIRAQLTQDIRPLSTRCPDVPERVAALVMRCLERSPELRPTSAAELLLELDDYAPSAPNRPRKIGRTFIALSIAGVVALAALTMFARRGTDSGQHTIAVIPLATLDTANDLLPDAVTDEVQTALAQIQAPGISIISRNAADQFRGKTIDVRAARSRLGVDHIVELRVRGNGSRIFIHAELVNTSNSVADWSQEYSETTDSVHVIPVRIADAVLAAMRSRAVDRGARTARHQPSDAAHYAYLRGRYIANRISGKADLDRALGYFREAEQLDPAYSEPYAASASVFQAASGADSVPPEFAYRSAEQLARRALELDSTNAEAHAAFGWSSAVLRWDWSTSEREIRRAIALDPSNAVAHSDYGFWLMSHGQLSDCVREGHRATQLDPMAGVGYLELFFCYSALRQRDSALSTYRRLQELAPGAFFGEAWDADVFRQKGMLDSAFALDSAASKFVGRPTSGLVLSLAALGRHDEATNAYAQLKALAARQFVTPEFMARAALGARRPDEAIAWMQRGMAIHSDMVLFLRYLPEFEPILNDARYVAMLRQMGLTNTREP